jgi:microcystin-dependent protein
MKKKLRSLSVALFCVLAMGLAYNLLNPTPALASEPFLGEIRTFSFDFAPEGWAACDGQLLPISQNTALFSLLSTTYGGDGVTTFALPDLRGRVPVGEGSGNGLTNRVLGQLGGEESHMITNSEMTVHNDSLPASSQFANGDTPGYLARAQTLDRREVKIYGTANSSGIFSSIGGNQSHENMQPYLVMNYCIAVQGIYPSRN